MVKIRQRHNVEIHFRETQHQLEETKIYFTFPSEDWVDQHINIETSFTCSNLFSGSHRPKKILPKYSFFELSQTVLWAEMYQKCDSK